MTTPSPLLAGVSKRTAGNAATQKIKPIRAPKSIGTMRRSALGLRVNDAWETRIVACTVTIARMGCSLSLTMISIIGE